ncbi:MAG: GTP cyclohydrolase II [Bradymonadia bacterium]
MTEHTIEGPFFAQTKLPTEHGIFDVRVYNHQGKEHLLISMGDIVGVDVLPIRVHSECLTGEVLGSLKCDCKPQLHAALDEVARRGFGAVLYLRQEGRGIGLGNKIRAYRLQEDGVDTVDANRRLGFGDDLRTYEMAAHMLLGISVHTVQLMTNNPAKIEGLEKHGIRVMGRIPIAVGENPVNADYLQTKRDRMGHLLADNRRGDLTGAVDEPRFALA